MYFFFFNDTATTEIYTLSLHDALPISPVAVRSDQLNNPGAQLPPRIRVFVPWKSPKRRKDGMQRRMKRLTLAALTVRSEEHTSELQSRQYLVCRLLLEKKKKNELNLRG